MFKFFHDLWELSPFIPTALKNKALMICNRFAPWLCAPVCHSSDLFCRKSAGLLKLEDLFPESMMEGMDWCVEHPYITAATVCTGITMLAYYGCSKRKSTKSNGGFSPKGSKSHKIRAG